MMVFPIKTPRKTKVFKVRHEKLLETNRAFWYYWAEGGDHYGLQTRLYPCNSAVY